MTRTVLVVEDEPLIRMAAVAMLETAGLSVVAFDNAIDALRFTRSHPRQVAAVFTDIDLDGPVDGVALAHDVRDSDPSITVMVTSGRCVERPDLPADVRFVTKPWRPLDIITAMQIAAER